PESSDITYTGIKYDLSEWWDTRFRYRVGIEVEELEGVDRYEPVDVYLTFQDNEHYVDSARLVSFNATGNDEWSSEIPIQLWNVSYYPSGFIESCTMTFLADVSAGLNQTYFLYYNENLDNINPPSYNTNFQSSLSSGTLTVRVGTGSIYEAQLAEGQGVIKFEKDSVDFHGINSLAPERRLTDSRLVLLAHMDEASGTFVSDASGNLINPGQISDNVNWVEGIVDYGLQFGGASNDTVSFGPVLEGTAEPFNDYTTKWTMTCWVKPTFLSTASTNHGTQNVIMAKASDPYNDNFEIGIVGSAGADYGKIHVYLDTDNSDTQRNFGIGNDIVLNQWNFIALRIDLTKSTDHVEVRINDNWFGSGNQWSSAVNMDQAVNSPFTIGSSEHINQYYTGIIDEVAIYNDTLSNTEIEEYKYGSKTATIDSITEIIDGDGQVFSRYEVNWTDLFDMHISDICSFYYDYNLWNINRTIYFDNTFDGTSTNTQMIPLNTYYDLTDLADSEDFYYFYDGLVENQGLIYDDFRVENYTIVHDPIHTDPGERWTVGLFVPKFYDIGTATSISYFEGNVTYDSQNDIVIYKPGYINDFYNNIGGQSNRLHIEFWEFIDNVYLSESASIQLFEDQNIALKNPVNLYVYEKDALFYNLKVNVTDIDNNLVPGAKITVWNETDFDMNWTMYTDDSGEALFTRLNNGSYILNATYEKYGKAPLTITTPQLIEINESTVDQTGLYELSFLNVELTSLNLTLNRFNSTSDYQGPLEGAKVTFWRDEGTGPELIGSENSDENGNTVFRWKNFTTASDGNITFGVEWFEDFPTPVLAIGDLDLETTSSNVTFYFHTANSSIVNCTFGISYETELTLTVFPDPDFNQMLGDTLNFQVNFTYNNNTDPWIKTPVLGATVSYTVIIGTTKINMNALYFNETSGGLYNLSIDTSNPVEPSGAEWLSERNYLIEIEASKLGIITEEVSTTFTLDPKITTLIGNETSLTGYWGEFLIMDITYTDVSFGGSNPINDATVRYSVIGVPSVFGSLSPYGVNGRYQLLLDTTDFPGSDSYTLQITANKQNYQGNTIYIDVTVLAIKSLINNSVGIYKTINVAFNDAQIFYFNYIIESSGIGLDQADVLTYEWTEEISGSIVDSGAGSLNDLGNGLYSLDFDTETREIATYTIIFNLEKENYAPRSGIIILNINPREFDVLLPSEYFDDNIVSGVSGQDLTFTIDISDLLNSSYITDSQVYLTFEGTQYPFTSLGDGTYQITLNKDAIPNAFFLPIPVSAVITISKTNYETLNVPITVNVGMVEIFGFPMFYFLMIVIGVAAVVGSLLTYRAVQKAKIPKFVKRAREISKSIKSRKSISDSLLYPSKQEYMVKKFGDKWNMLGLSLEDILGLETKKKKKLPQMGESEGGEI
ncbi:MAG: LamG-like jellyroll fold domain-containing protein, partial [Candidatus Thorarchaeota archaeon]